MPEPPEQPRIASKKSIRKAYSLLRSLRPAKPRRPGQPVKAVVKRRTRKTEQERKCDRVLKTLVPNYSSTSKTFPWHDNFMMQEFRNALGKQDWLALQRLFPFCGTDSLAFQPMRFTYAFILCLCSSISNEKCFENFLDTCISHNLAETGVLEKLMTLQRTYRRQTKTDDD